MVFSSRSRVYLCAGLALAALFGVAAAGRRDALAQTAGQVSTQGAEPNAEQLFALANQTRAEHGLGRLKWDPALAVAAQRHCQRMTVEGALSHRYAGELDVTERAGQAGAHFSLVEENIALGADPAKIHQAWMESPGHRANLLSPDIDSVGIAVMTANGAEYAVADYSRGVAAMDREQVEEHFADLLRAKGVAINKDASEARAYCASSGHFRAADGPSFMMRWENPDISALPPEVEKAIAAGGLTRAAVGSCAAQESGGGFTSYRVGVLLW
jgi:hypothetical protein